MLHLLVAKIGKKFLWLCFAYKHPTLLPVCLTEPLTIQYILCGKDDLEEIGFLDVNGIGSG